MRAENRDLRCIIKQACKRNKKNLCDLAAYLEMTPQQLNNKFRLDRIRGSDMLKICEFLNCRIVLEEISYEKEK